MILKNGLKNGNIDQVLRLKARSCKDCLGWLDECKAECCSIVQFKMLPAGFEKSKDTIAFKKICTPDMVWYYKLRGVKYAHGTLFFPKKRFIAIGRACVYVRKCELLGDDYRCKGHPDAKPNFCKDFNLDTVVNDELRAKSVYLTPRCLFRYKVMDL